MDSDCFANHNFSRKLDQLFCGFLSCCAMLLQDDEEKEHGEVNYIYNKQPKLLIQYESDSELVNSQSTMKSVYGNQAHFNSKKLNQLKCGK